MARRGWWLALTFLCIAPAIGLPARRAAAAVTISGTLTYSGAQGPVSNLHPIRIVMYDDPFLQDNFVDGTTVTANGAAFALNAPTAGIYYLFYWLDANDDFANSVGEPFELSNDQFDFPAEPLAVPQSGLALDFDDTGIISGIAGTVTYTGALGPVTASHSICACLFGDSDLTFALGCTAVATNGGRFNLATLDTNTYYVTTFLDLNNNIELDPGEPFLIYNNKGAPPADPIAAGPTQTAINITFGDTYVATPPTPSATKTQTPTLTSAPTHTPSPTRTQTPTLTPVPTHTPSSTRTQTPTRTPTPSPTSTPDRTASSTPTPTPTSTPTATASGTPGGSQCTGDCDGSGEVTIDELLTLVNIALENAPVSDCMAGDEDGDGHVTVDEILVAVNNALDGCPTT